MILPTMSRASSNLVTFTPAGSPSAPPPPPVGTVTLTVVGNPATGPWGVKATTTDPRDVMATVRLDGAVHHVEHTAPYGFPDDNGTTATTGRFGRLAYSGVRVLRGRHHDRDRAGQRDRAGRDIVRWLRGRSGDPLVLTDDLSFRKWATGSPTESRNITNGSPILGPSTIEKRGAAPAPLLTFHFRLITDPPGTFVRANGL